MEPKTTIEWAAITALVLVALWAFARFIWPRGGALGPLAGDSGEDPGQSPNRSTRAEDLRALLGLTRVPHWLVGAAIALWCLIFLVLVSGLLWSILSALGLGYADTEDEQAALRFILITVTALTATLGALVALPFTLVRTQFAGRQTNATEEGLVTDRINAAVLGLGAEKEVSRHLKDDAGDLLYHDKEGSTGDLDFKRPVIVQTTEPNLEVRIGAILALERIATRNLDVHVQIMQILCAYIRENAPASDAVPGSPPIASFDELPEEDRDDDAPTHQQRWAIHIKNHETVQAWKAGLSPVRSDIVTALQVIERRNAEQRRTEAAYGKGDGTYPFDTPPPPFQAHGGPEAYSQTVTGWLRTLEAYRGYRPDLRDTNLQGAAFAGFDMRAVRLEGAQVQGADLSGAQMRGANLRGAQMQRANLSGAQMQRANLINAQMQGTDLCEAQLQGANLRGTQMQRAELGEAQMQGADLGGAQMQAAYLTMAQMQRADLSWAQMQGAYLAWTQMQGTNLSDAQMQGAELYGTEMDEATDLRAATLRGAVLKSIDDFTLAQLKPFLDEVFCGDDIDDHNDWRRAWWAWRDALDPPLPKAWRHDISDPD